MADVCVLCVNGLPAFPLKPNEIYRIGKQAGLEICIADESMELAHGIVSLLRSGIVRIAAVAGRIFVNEEEKQISDIRKEDARDGKVRLRFGNVEASLRFNEANEEAQEDSSGFAECLKDRTVDTTDDSMCIPETQPPSANASVNTTADSFFIPETQALVFERPTGKAGKVSLGDDFVIPETENAPDSAELHQETTTRDSDASESSGMGSQIRICTQDFNEFNEDAIDDFDSSLMLGDALMALAPPKPMKESPEKLEKQDNLLDATDLEMSALNWSATNSKCTVLNSTKADEAHRTATCITPDLSAPLADANRDISTPDIFELMEAHEAEEQAAQRSNATTPQLCGIKQLVVATIETPRTTQNEEDEGDSALVNNQDINQDFVATQAFPSRLNQSKECSERANQDFIATQAFPSRLNQSKESSEKANQDFIATQVFPSKANISGVRQDSGIDQDLVATQAFPSLLNQSKKSSEKLNQDFIATQVFPSKSKLDNDDVPPLNQDFIATQAFPSRLNQSKKSSEKANENLRLTHLKESSDKPNQDFIATQVFPSKSITTVQTAQDSVETQPFHSNKENIPQDTDSWDDEIEQILNEMTSGNVASSPPSSPNEEVLKYVKPCVIKDKDHNRKVFLFENVFPNADNSGRWKNELLVEEKRCLKRVVSTDSQPSFVTPNKKNRRLSEHSERLDDDCPTLSCSRKRPANVQKADKSEPPIKSRCKVSYNSEQAELSTEDEAVAPKVANRHTRRAKTKSRSPTPTVETNRVKKVTRTRSKEAKSKEDKPKENPERVIRTRRETNSSDPEEVSTKLPEEITTKKKADDEAADQASAKKIIKELVESVKKKSQEAKDEAEQSVSKMERKKDVGSAKKDSEKPKNVTKRSRGRPRKYSISSSEEPLSKIARPKMNTRPDSIPNNSLAALHANKEDEEAEQSVSKRDRKKLVESAKKKSKEAKEEAEETTSKRGIKKLVESAKKKSEEAKDEGEQQASKRDRRKAVDSAKKDSEEPESVTKHRRGRPRKYSISSSEESISKIARPKTNTRPDAIPNNSLATSHANKETTLLDESLALRKNPVVRLKRTVSAESPSTSNFAKSAGNSVEEKASKNTSSASKTRPSQENQKDSLKAINKYLRELKSNGKIRIVFTMCDRLSLNFLIRALKHVVEVTEDPQQCDVLIMDKGERTYKFLTAIALNKPVLNSQWLQSVKSTKSISVKDEHLFNDTNFKKGFKFDPFSALQHPLVLNGFNFLLCEGIQPKVNEMTVIIQSAGGIVHIKPPSLALSKDLYVVTTSKDQHSKQRLRNYENVHYIKTEGVMASLVQHKVELLDEHKVKL